MQNKQKPIALHNHTIHTFTPQQSSTAQSNPSEPATSAQNPGEAAEPKCPPTDRSKNGRCSGGPSAASQICVLSGVSVSGVFFRVCSEL